MAERIFADGLKITAKETQFGTIYKFGIKAEPFMDFLAKYINGKGYVNLDMKQAKSGKWYLELDTYSLKKNQNNTPTSENDNLCSFDDMEEADFVEVPF